ncbi:hypothetical protein RV12_GL001673 [Enterococcus quebecensis]|nr:hypothetical protein RV12_GL001673 [Enterococcus quebecensis]
MSSSFLCILGVIMEVNLEIVRNSDVILCKEIANAGLDRDI